MSTISDSTTASSVSSKYSQDGDEAKEIAKYLPYFPFKGIPRFYDIGGFLAVPHVFQKIVNIFADRYSEIGVDLIAGYVAFVLNTGLRISSFRRQLYLLTSHLLLQLGRSWIHIGSSHCLGAQETLCYDAKKGQNAQLHFLRQLQN